MFAALPRRQDSNVFRRLLPASLTYVGFHGHYDFDKLNTASVEKNDLAGWTLKFTDHKVDPKLMRRWIEIERRAGDMRFYPPAAAKRFGQVVALCQGTESLRPQQCEKITTNAFAQGIVTTPATYSSPDATTLPYKLRETRHPSTNFATLTQSERLPARSPAARRDFDLFNHAALPRAFAVTASGAAWVGAPTAPSRMSLALNAPPRHGRTKETATRRACSTRWMSAWSTARLETSAWNGAAYNSRHEKRVLVLAGGQSGEHEVSINSARVACLRHCRKTN